MEEKKEQNQILTNNLESEKEMNRTLTLTCRNLENEKAVLQGNIYDLTNNKFQLIKDSETLKAEFNVNNISYIL